MYKGLHNDSVSIYNAEDIVKCDIHTLKEPNKSVQNHNYARNLLDKNYISKQWNNVFNNLLNI